MLETYSQNLAVGANTAISFNNISIQKGVTAVKTAPATVQFNRAGVYMVSFDATAAISGATAGNITVQLYKNGTAQPQALTSTNSTSTTDLGTLSFVTLVQVPQNNNCNCATSGTTIQLLNIGLDATFTQANLVITKIC